MKKLILILIVFSSQSFAQEKYCYVSGSGNNFQDQLAVMNEIKDRCDRADVLRVELSGKKSGGRSIGNMNTVTDIVSFHCDFAYEIVITEGTNLTLQCINHSKYPRTPNIKD